MPLNLLAGGAPRPHFFYCTGTAYLTNIFQAGLLGMDFLGGYAGNLDPIKGLNGQVSYFRGGVQNDPFPSMLDPSKWVSQKVDYQDAMWPMVASIDSGVRAVVDKISKLPKGTPFGLGGYSQGAAVMSVVLRYHLQRPGPSVGTLPPNYPYPVVAPYPDISGRLGDLKAGVMFGNPSRQANKLWGPWKGRAPIYNPTIDNPGGSPSSGGRGVFPAVWRNNATPSLWWEFSGGNIASNKGNTPSLAATPDFVTGAGGVDGDGTIGGKVTALAEMAFNQPFMLVGVAFAFAAGLVNGGLDALGASFVVGDRGHVSYPKFPPPGYESPDDPTSYQIALEYLDYVGSQNQLAPSVIPRGIGGTMGTVTAGTIRGGRGTPAFRPVPKPSGTPAGSRGPTPTTVLKPPPINARGFRPNGTTGGLPNVMG